MKYLRLLAILVVLVWGAALAQEPSPNDPAVSEDANACFAGGTMDGKCALDADGDGALEDFEEDWAWTCGWYLIRLESGDIRSEAVPESCLSLLSNGYRCYINSDIGNSFLYTGPNGTIGNIVFFPNLECAGEGLVAPISALIINSSEAEALAICESLGPVMFFDLASNAGWSTPADYYGCDVALVTRGAAGTFGATAGF